MQKRDDGKDDGNRAGGDVRIDKWLWAARFYKTRTLATQEVGKGRVRINDQDIKPSREVRPGDLVAIHMDGVTRTVQVKGLSHLRGPAPVAQQMYEETPQSVAQREAAREQSRLAPEPAHSIEEGRPTKRDRRNIGRATEWNDRWSASMDD